MQSYAPSELIKHPDLVFHPVDIQKVRNDLNEGGQREIVARQLKLGRYPARMFLKGTLTTDGITFMESQWGDKFSFGMQFDMQEDADALYELAGEQGPLAQFLASADPDTQYEIKDVLKDEVLYIKCKTNGEHSKFLFNSNYKLHPKRKNLDIVRWMPVECQVDVGAYVNVVNNTAGLYFTLRDLTFRQHEEVDAMEESVPAAATPPPRPRPGSDIKGPAPGRDPLEIQRKPVGTAPNVTSYGAQRGRTTNPVAPSRRVGV